MHENENIEEWRDVVGFEGLYEVSSLGRVKSLANKKTRKEKILRQGKLKNGYLIVRLNKYKKSKTFYVHRLVANAFIPNPNGYRCVNHKDENPLNNFVDNLEWCTYQYNLNYGTAQAKRVASTDYKAFQAKRVANTDYKAFQAKRVSSTDWKAKVANTDYKAIGRKNAEKLSRQVFQYSKDGTLIKIWNSTQECGRSGYNQGNVAACCRGELKTHRGYIWSYTPII